MKESIHKTHDRDEYFFEEGCCILEMWNTPEDDATSITRARVRPGYVTAWHLLKNIVERYVFMAGAGRVEVGDLPLQNVAAVGRDQKKMGMGNSPAPGIEENKVRIEFIHHPPGDILGKLEEAGAFFIGQFMPPEDVTF